MRPACRPKRRWWWRRKAPANRMDNLGASNADGGGVGRHQRIEWIALALPGLVDLPECILLGQSQNANVLLVLVMTAEQPPVHVLAQLCALRRQFLKIGFGMLLAI